MMMTTVSFFYLVLCTGYINKYISLEEHLFSSVLSKLQPPQENPHLDETEAEHAAHAHEKIYNNQNNTQASSRDMGSAAAMQAFKMFSGGNKSSGGSSNELVGLAMGEAMKLFKSQGGSSSGANQSEMLQQAAMMAMKLYMTQQAGNNQGGASGGGLGQVMGILGSLSGGQQQQQQPQKHSSGVSSLLGKFL